MANGAHLCSRQASPLLQSEHDRGGGLLAFADEHAGFWCRQMHAGGFDRVNGFNRAGKIGFTRTAQGFTFNRAA